MLLEAIAGQVVVAHPSVDDQYRPKSCGQSTHADLSLFGVVCPVHAIVSQNPAVKNILLEGTFGQYRGLQPSGAPSNVHPYASVIGGQSSHTVRVLSG